jgi:hypothetical protein
MLMHYIKKWPDMNKFSIRWKNMFPAQPNDVRGNRSLMDFCVVSNESWADLFDGGNKPVKTFVNTCAPLNYNLITNETHNPHNGSPSYMCNGELLNGNWYNGPNDDSELKILHFQYKSRNEWVTKCRRNIDAGVLSRGHYNKSREQVWEAMI